MGTNSKTRLFPSSSPLKAISIPFSIIDATVARFPAAGATWLSDRSPDEITESDFLDPLRSSLINDFNDLPCWADQLKWEPARQRGHTPKASTGPSSSMAAKKILAFNGALSGMTLCWCSRWHQTLQNVQLEMESGWEMDSRRDWSCLTHCCHCTIYASSKVSPPCRSSSTRSMTANTVLAIKVAH